MLTLLLLGVSAAVAGTTPGLIEDVRSPAGDSGPVMEKKVLFNGRSASEWQTAESTMAASTNRTKSGPASLHWHVTVDYATGEPNYPIGWPRVYHPIPAAAARDWSAWDYLEMWVYTETSRDALPQTPMSLIIRSADRSDEFDRTLTELKKGEWTKTTIALTAIPKPERINQMQFYISESNYRHRDEVIFYIDEISLVRYAEPVLLEFAPEKTAVFNNAKNLPVKFRLSGVAPNGSVEVSCELVRANKVVAQTVLKATRGAQRVIIDLEKSKLEPGDYKIIGRIKDGTHTVTEPVRIVESPWNSERKAAR